MPVVLLNPSSTATKVNAAETGIGVLASIRYVFVDRKRLILANVKQSLAKPATKKKQV